MAAFDQASADLVALDAQVAQADAAAAAIGLQTFGSASLTGSAYAAPVQQYQAVGSTGTSKVGPEINAASGSSSGDTTPYTTQASLVAATLAAIPTSGRSSVQGQADVASASSLARQMIAIYRQAIAAGTAATTSPAPPNLPPPPAPPTPPAGSTTPATPATSTPVPSTVAVASHALGWKALLTAYGVRHPGAAAPAALQYALAQAIGAEGSFTGYFRGTNNLGAMQATAAFAAKHASDPGYGMVAFLDHGPGAYIARMKVFPSLAIGAEAYLALLEADLGADWSTITSASVWSERLYVHGYFGGMATPRTPLSQRAAASAANSWNAADQANIAAYAAAIQAHLPAAAAAASQQSTSDPTLVTSGAFAPLADRLTPGPMYAPHTVDHARELLGRAADNPPPGAVSLGDCLSPVAGGEGVWMFAQGATVLPMPGRGPRVQLPPPGGQTPVAAAPPSSIAPVLFGSAIAAAAVVAIVRAA